VEIQQANFGWGSHVLEFFAVGTAVVREGHIPAASEPGLMLALNDPPRRQALLTRGGAAPPAGDASGSGSAAAAAG